MPALSPFFDKQHIPDTNIGSMMRSFASSLNDEQFVSWADGLNWSEPVVSIKAFGTNSRSGRYEHAEISVWSLIEIAIMLGDERIVDLLVTRDRFPKRYNFNGATLKKSSHMDTPIEISIVNAAIKTGSPHILSRVLPIVSDQQLSSISNWFSNSYYSPLTCLADQKIMPKDRLMSIWEMMRAHAVSCGESLMPGHGNNIRGSFEEKTLLEACRLGNVSLTEEICARIGRKMSPSMWSDLLHEGNIAWCSNFLAKHDRWPGKKASARHVNHNESCPPAKLLATCIEQVKSVRQVFDGHEKLKGHLSTAIFNMESVVKSLAAARDGGSLLSLESNKWGSEIAAPLINFDVSFAIGILNRLLVPLSLYEALTIAKEVIAEPCLGLVQSRMQHGTVEISQLEASSLAKNFIESSDQDMDPAAVASILKQWEVLDFENWEISPEFKSSIAAATLNLTVPSPARPESRFMRRM